MAEHIELLFQAIEMMVAIGGLIFAIVGIYLPLKKEREREKRTFEAQLEQDKRAWRMQLLDEQISKYYGPISAILHEQTTISERVWEQIGRRKIFENGKDKLSDLSEDEQLIWKHFVDNYKIPLQRQVVDIMRNNAHLAIRGRDFGAVGTFLDYALGWEYLDSQMRNGVPNFYEYYYSYNYPAAFNNYIDSTLNMLLDEKQDLLESV